MSVMQLDKNWSIEADSRCWTLTYTARGAINPDTGKPKETHSATFHASLKQCLLYYLDKVAVPATSATEVLDAITTAETNVEKALDAFLERL